MCLAWPGANECGVHWSVCLWWWCGYSIYRWGGAQFIDPLSVGRDEIECTALVRGTTDGVNFSGMVDDGLAGGGDVEHGWVACHVLPRFGAAPHGDPCLLALAFDHLMEVASISSTTCDAGDDSEGAGGKARSDMCNYRVNL